MIPTPASVFDSRSAAFALEKDRYQKKARALAWLRLTIFVAGLAAAIYHFKQGQNGYGFLCAGLCYGLFLAVLKWHTRIQYSRRHFGFLEKINQEEQERLKGRLSGFNAGNRFRDAQHPYTSDLDIFGPFSLFQLLNRAVSSLGQQQLASWLQQGAPAAEITDRQQAMLELATDIDWRQHLQAKALHYQHTVEEPFLFFDWLQSPDFYRA